VHGSNNALQGGYVLFEPRHPPDQGRVLNHFYIVSLKPESG